MKGIAQLQNIMEIVRKQRNITIRILFLLTLISCQKTHKEYYDDGEVKSVFELKNELLDGQSEEYYESGQLKSSGYWKEGKREGLFEYFFESGQLQMSENYSSGLRNGRLVRYYENGQLETTCDFFNDEKINKQESYYEGGQLESVFSYSPSGKLLSFNEYEIDGTKKLNSRVAFFHINKHAKSQKDSFEVEVRLGNRLFDSLALIVGRLDSNYNLIDTTSILSSEDYVFTYSGIPDKSDSYTISGVFNDIYKSDKKMETHQIPFVQKFEME